MDKELKRKLQQVYWRSNHSHRAWRTQREAAHDYGDHLRNANRAPKRIKHVKDSRLGDWSRNQLCWVIRNTSRSQDYQRKSRNACLQLKTQATSFLPVLQGTKEEMALFIISRTHLRESWSLQTLRELHKVTPRWVYKFEFINEFPFSVLQDFSLLV